MRPDIFLATIGRGSNGSNALEVTEDRAAVTAESQDNIINRVNNLSQYGPSWHYVPGIGVAGTAYAEVPGSALGDLAFSRASSKTRTNSAGVVETIGNNVPPHDYRNADGTLSTFPRLNLEPQRTNSLTRTTNFSSGWTFMQTTLGASSTGPGGANTAFRITNNSSVVDPYYEQSVTPSANTWCWSIYVKQGTASQAWIYPVHVGLGADTSYARFNFATKTFTNLGNIQSSGYQELGNGLFRIWCTVNITSAVTSLRARFSNGTTANVYNDWAYPQLEVGAYPTTYIPTTTAAVTRLADNTGNLNVASLGITNQYSIYYELGSFNLSALSIWMAQATATSNCFEVFGESLVLKTASGDAYPYVHGTTGTQFKGVITFDGANIRVFKNGVKFGPYAANLSRWTSFTNFDLNQAVLQTVNWRQVALFNKSLTDAQCIQMTTL